MKTVPEGQAPAVQHFAPDGAVSIVSRCEAFEQVLSFKSTSAADVPAARQSRLAGEGEETGCACLAGKKLFQNCPFLIV